jgi:hypothetical protein
MLINLGDLRLRGWQRLDSFLIFRVIRIGDLYKGLLITHYWLPELFHHHHHLLLLTLLMLPLLKALSRAMSRNFLQLF